MKFWPTPAVVNKMRNQVDTSFDFRGIVAQFSFNYRGKKQVVRKPFALRNQVVVYHNTDRWVAELESAAKARNS